MKVAVYRHVTTPGEITVNIESIHPLPPAEPKEPSDPVAKLLKPGDSGSFKIESTYPEER
ncbi:hypothetical protein ES703_70920 [subsurface metagenome]